MPVRDGRTVVLTSGDAPGPLAALPRVELSGRPGRAEVDPLLRDVARLVVVGDDGDLAAVLLRLLRTEHLDVELALVAAAATPATRLWGLGHGAAAAVRAVDGTAAPAVLVRDAHGSVLVGRTRLTGADGGVLRGEAYCDDVRVFSGEVPELVAAPTPDGPGVAVTVRRAGLAGRLGRARTVTGRALQVGSTGAVVVRDGVAVERPAPRWSLYRHTEDWHLVR